MAVVSSLFCKDPYVARQSFNPNLTTGITACEECFDLPMPVPRKIAPMFSEIRRPPPALPFGLGTAWYLVLWGHSNKLYVNSRYYVSHLFLPSSTCLEIFLTTQSQLVRHARFAANRCFWPRWPRVRFAC